MSTPEELLNSGGAMAPQDADAMQPQPAVTPQPAPGAIPPTQQPAQAGYGAQLSGAATQVGSAISESGNDALAWLKDKAKGLTGEKDPMVIDPNVLNNPETFREIAGIYMAYGKPEGLKYLEHAMTMQKEGGSRAAIMLMGGDTEGALQSFNQVGDIKFSKIAESTQRNKAGGAMYDIFGQDGKLLRTIDPEHELLKTASPDVYFKSLSDSREKAAERARKEAEKANDREHAMKLQDRSDERLSKQEDSRDSRLAANNEAMLKRVGLQQAGANARDANNGSGSGGNKKDERISDKDMQRLFPSTVNKFVSGKLTQESGVDRNEYERFAAWAASNGKPITIDTHGAWAGAGKPSSGAKPGNQSGGARQQGSANRKPLSSIFK